MAVDRPIGAHVKSGNPLDVAAAIGADCVQIFLSDPQSWKKPVSRDDAEALRTSGVPVFVHAPYLVNVAAANNRIRIPSRKILQDTCDGAAAVGARAVIVHGGHVTEDDAVQDGVERWRKALETLRTDVPVYLENTAGGDFAMARVFDDIARLWERVGDLGLGFCLDTCHAHAAGEEVATAAERILAITGRIDLVHANDSRDPFASGRDRHEHLGKGQIDLDAIVAVARAAGSPIVCETQDDHVADDIAVLRAALEG